VVQDVTVPSSIRYRQRNSPFLGLTYLFAMPIFHGAHANITGGVFNDIGRDQNNYYFTADSENGTENEATGSAINTLLIFSVQSSRGSAP
jgi:hypothetical protein